MLGRVPLQLFRVILACSRASHILTIQVSGIITFLAGFDNTSLSYHYGLLMEMLSNIMPSAKANVELV